MRMTQRHSDLSRQHRLKAMENLGHVLTAKDILVGHSDWHKPSKRRYSTTRNTLKKLEPPAGLEPATY